jgi:nucleoid-associated protein YgaU
MPTVSLKALRDRALAISDGFNTAQAAVIDAVRSGSATELDYRYLGSELRGLEQDVRNLRRDLDATSVADQLIHTDGAKVILLWRWERGLRHDLVRVAAKLRGMIEVTAILERGAEHQVYVVRSGDTLQKIAQATLGDWREWPRLLTANPGLEPGEVASGTLLTIPKPR